MKQLAISGLKTSFVFLKNRHSKNIILGLLIAFCALISDLASKNLVLEILQQSATQLKATSGNSNNNFLQIRIFDFFSLVYVENRGISFGMFNNLYDSNKIFTLIQGSIEKRVLQFSTRRFYQSYLGSFEVGKAEWSTHISGSCGCANMT
jgi:lipoprotein signal peptidase